jgi:putative ABC transport system permease protein
MRKTLVIAEIAAAFVLAIGAGLLGRSLDKLLHVDTGYDPHNILTLTAFAHDSHTDEAVLQYYRQLVERIRVLPGVESAAMVSTVPLGQPVRPGLSVEGRSLSNDAEVPRVDLCYATPDYFRLMRIPLKRGRGFGDGDRLKDPPVALISESCARSQFPTEDPIGRRIRFDGSDGDGSTAWATVIGVVGDVWQHGMDDGPSAGVYMPQSQHPGFYYRLLARTAGDPWSVFPSVRAAMRELNPREPLFHVQPMDAYVTKSLADRIFTLSLVGLLGALALTLAAVGIYGVVSYTVSLRTREVGIRIALGAGRGDVLRLVMRDLLAMLGWGLAAGFLSALALTRFLAHLLYQVQPTDLATTATAALALACVALGAGYVPYRHAIRISPSAALRHD